MVPAGIGETADWFLRGTRAYALAVILFASVAITGTFAPEFLIVHNLAFLSGAFLVIVAGYTTRPLPSAFLVGVGPYLGSLTGTVLQDTLVAGRIRGTYWLSVFSVPRIVFIVGATAALYAFGYLLGELVRRVSRRQFPTA